MPIAAAAGIPKALRSPMQFTDYSPTLLISSGGTDDHERGDLVGLDRNLRITNFIRRPTQNRLFQRMIRGFWHA